MKQNALNTNYRLSPFFCVYQYLFNLDSLPPKSLILAHMGAI